MTDDDDKLEQLNQKLDAYHCQVENYARERLVFMVFTIAGMLLSFLSMALAKVIFILVENPGILR